MSRYKSQWYADYMRSPHWVETRERMIELAGRVCEFCGAPENHTAWNEFIALNVHHVNYDHLWHETRADLIVLCHDCHSDAHKFPKRLEEIKRFAARRPLPDHYAAAEQAAALEHSDPGDETA